MSELEVTLIWWGVIAVLSGLFAWLLARLFQYINRLVLCNHCHKLVAIRGVTEECPRCGRAWPVPSLQPREERAHKPTPAPREKPLSAAAPATKAGERPEWIPMSGEPRAKKTSPLEHVECPKCNRVFWAAITSCCPHCRVSLDPPLSGQSSKEKVEETTLATARASIGGENMRERRRVICKHCRATVTVHGEVERCPFCGAQWSVPSQQKRAEPAQKSGGTGMGKPESTSARAARPGGARTRQVQSGEGVGSFVIQFVAVYFFVVIFTSIVAQAIGIPFWLAFVLMWVVGVPLWMFIPWPWK